MGREYTVTFEKINVSAVQDLFLLVGAAGKICRLKRAAIADVDATLPAAQNMALRVRFLPATVTNGSAGAAATPKPFDTGDPAASFTARVNDTTKATTSGTAVILEENGAFLYSGWDYSFPYPPTFGPSEAIVVELITTPSATWILSGSVTVEEIGG